MSKGLGLFKVPGFAYPGGKVRLRKWLVSMMPRKGRRFVDLFAGRGNVSWLAMCALGFQEWWLNDIYTKPFFDAIRDVDVADLPFKFTRDWARDAKKGTSALEIVLSPWMSYSGGTVGGISRCTLYHSSRYKKTIQNAKRILRARSPTITALDWTDVLGSGLCSDDFVYLDPPYMNASAGYAVDTVDHADLLRALKQTSARWLLSGYESELYLRELGAPSASRLSAIYMKTAHGEGSKPPRLECVWKNY